MTGQTSDGCELSVPRWSMTIRSRSRLAPALIRFGIAPIALPPGPPVRYTTGSAPASPTRAGTIATIMRICVPLGSERSSGTTRKPQFAFASSFAGSAGQVAGSNVAASAADTPNVTMATLANAPIQVFVKGGTFLSDRAVYRSSTALPELSLPIPPQSPAAILAPGWRLPVARSTFTGPSIQTLTRSPGCQAGKPRRRLRTERPESSSTRTIWSWP